MLAEDDWAYLDIELVEKHSGKYTNFIVPVEYYSGYEDGEHWTEGDFENYAILSDVDKGDYVVNCKAIGSSALPLDYKLTVVKNETVWRNFVLFVIIAGIYPLYLYWRKRRFETNRWSQSNIYHE